MRAKTEEFLYLLFWSLDTAARPSFRNLDQSFEAWAYRHGFLRQVERLERRKLVERKSTSKSDRVFRLSQPGRLHALGGRDPEERWHRKWDGSWRVVLFDIPTSRNAQRDRVRRYLQHRGFGYLQNSVWITPDSIEEERQLLMGGDIDVEALVFLEARPCAGESNDEIVAGAWDFERINRRYARCLEILAEKPAGLITSGTVAKDLLNWGRREREEWLKAVRADPLLPAAILPRSYLGRKAWKKRREILRHAGRQVRLFR